MEYFLYILAGFSAAVLGALPPGAVNLSVVYTTINRGAQAAIPIILTAAVGEIVLSFFALHCAMTVEHYIQQNIILQYSMAAILILAGLFLFLKKKQAEHPKPNGKNHGVLKGLALSILNPPVLVFWLVAFAYLAAHTNLSLSMGLVQLSMVFFLGVFIGKILTLWLYMQLSKRIAARAQHITFYLNKGISVLLIVVGTVQFGKLLL